MFPPTYRTYLLLSSLPSSYFPLPIVFYLCTFILCTILLPPIYVLPMPPTYFLFKPSSYTLPFIDIFSTNVFTYLHAYFMLQFSICHIYFQFHHFTSSSMHLCNLPVPTVLLFLHTSFNSIFSSVFLLLLCQNKFIYI